MKTRYLSGWSLIVVMFLLIAGCSDKRIAIKQNISKIWQPKINDTWQIQLNGKLNTGYQVDVYDIDLFDTSVETIRALKTQAKHVVCYFSAGSSENWRADFKQFADKDLGNKLSGWAGERWLDTRSSLVREIMLARLDIANKKGCDAVDPDNVDGYANNTGFNLNASTQFDYNVFLSTAAHARGLSIGLKNDIQQLGELSSKFDFAINEQCFYYKECDAYQAFIALGKPVFNVEYAATYVKNTSGARDALCTAAQFSHIHTLVLSLSLDDTLRYSCEKF